MAAKILSIYYKKNKLGCAYYEQKTTTLYLMSDIPEEKEFRHIRSLLHQVSPTLLLTSKNEDVDLLNYLHQHCLSRQVEREDNLNGNHCQENVETKKQKSVPKTGLKRYRNEIEAKNGDDNNDNLSDFSEVICNLHVMPQMAYDYESGKKRIAALFGLGNDDKEEYYLQLAFRIDLASVHMIQALGSLLKYLDAIRLGVEFEDHEVKTPITKERHPSAFKACTYGGTREGLSIFEICNRCRSSPGKNLLKQWFEMPTSNITVLKNRADAVEYFIQDVNFETVEFIRKTLRRIFSLKTCSNMLAITTYIEVHGIKLELIASELEHVDDAIIRITAIMEEMINFEESQIEDRFIVNANIDPNLDRLKKIYANLPQTLTEVANKEAEVLGVDYCSVKYVPMFGFLLGLSNETSLDPTVINDLEFIYEADGYKFMKNRGMRNLDSEVGDIKMEIVDTETAIILQSMVSEYSVSLLHSLRACATLDCLISLALTAREYSWCRPLLVNESVIDIDGSRHPISELFSSTKFVSNPIRSGGLQTKVGIIIFLAHIGSFVPAEQAVIGLFDRIDSRMYVMDCVQDKMSSFTKDISQISVSLQKATSRSLVIIDEFGKGTTNEVGLSLLASSLNYWIRKGKDVCPHVFASTHYHSLYKYLDLRSDILSFYAMEAAEENGELEFSYRFIPGTIDMSFCSYTARKVGIPSTVIERSNQIYEQLKANLAIIPIELVEVESDSSADYYRISECFFEWDIENDCEGFLNYASSLLSVNPLPVRNSAEEQEHADINSENNEKCDTDEYYNEKQKIDREQKSVSSYSLSSGNTPQVSKSHDSILSDVVIKASILKANPNQFLTSFVNPLG
ncbi:unnamed protein product [Dracunculus medinensis]|uniref:DNA_MISMATCH_REPAIR_2 domain-containing protein n=1 Tax=Dracunculus medinensis TaxID=318479 RepID=A0A0N4UHB4_DRAME|nr:unnamed protein product [Dracunculus medinensis]